MRRYVIYDTKKKERTSKIYSIKTHASLACSLMNSKEDYVRYLVLEVSAD